MPMTRRGVSVIELLVVMSVIALLAGIGTPSVTGIQRRSATRSAAAAIADLWRQARSLAITQTTEADGRHYGVRIESRGGGGGTVQLIHSNGRDAVVLQERPIPASIVVVIDGAPGTLEWFAQFGSGAPIDAATVDSVSAATAPPRAVGVPSQPWAPSICSEVLVHARSFVASAPQAGLAYRLRIDGCGHDTQAEVR